jgi:hypothetical protein
LRDSAHLETGGFLVIEVGVPGLQRLPPGETVRAFTVSPRPGMTDELLVDRFVVNSAGVLHR